MIQLGYQLMKTVQNLELNDNDLEKVSGGYVSIVYSEGTIFVHKDCSYLVIKIKCAIYVDPNNNNNNKYKVDYWDYRQGKSSVEKERIIKVTVHILI